MGAPLAVQGVVGMRIVESFAGTIRWLGVCSIGSSRLRGVLDPHAAVSNLFNLGRHLVRAKHYRDLRVSAFEEWGRAVA